MIGSFSSEKQSKFDTTYFNISLHMYPIWESLPGDWLYVEQAVYSMQEKPYRQRVYKVEMMPNGKYASHVFRLENEKDFVGKWNDPDFFNDYDTSILEIREGCTVFLETKEDGTIAGSTNDKACGSTLRGASYATSIVTVFDDKIVSWDQGFSGDDKQVWGATEGGYIFDRLD